MYTTLTKHHRPLRTAASSAPARARAHRLGTRLPPPRRGLWALAFAWLLCATLTCSVRAYSVHLPVVTGPREPTPPGCEPLPAASYRLLTILGEPSGIPAAQHPDINLALRGVTSAQGVSATLLDNCTSAPDEFGAPQLRGLFADHRRPTVMGAYWVYQWDWDKSRPASGVESTWGAQHITVAVTPGEILRVPPSDYCIDKTHNLEVLVLYATPERVTLKYTREDDVLRGYTLHLEGLCVDPALVALYEQADGAGRSQLPALQAGQAFARARTHALGISTRDSGAWMDPRHCADWWRT